MVVLGVFPVNMLELINIHSGKSYKPTSAQGRQRVLQIDLLRRKDGVDLSLGVEA